jgi:hypothetical protein
MPAFRVALGGDREGGFRQIILCRDRLQYGVVQPGVERHDGGRIAGERRVGEGVDLGEGQAGHGVS